MIIIKYGLTHRILQDLTKNEPFMTTLGIANYSDLQGHYEAMEVFDKIELIVYAVNSLEALDAIVDPITREGTEATTIEIYTRSKFERSAFDAPSTAYKPKMSEITVPFTDYGVGVEINQKMFMKDENFVVEQILASVVPAYRMLHRRLALKAMMELKNPATDTSYNPGFWRNITNVGQAITPHPNGLLKFTSAETHYMYGALNEKVLNKLTKKIRDKGYGNSGVVIVANESTWEAYKDLFDVTELEKMVIVDTLEGSEFTINPNKKTLVQLSDADFPMGYFLAYDPTVKGLYRKVAEKESMRGLVKQFSSLDEVRVSRRADFMAYELGYGVVERGFGAVMYVGEHDSTTGAFTAPSAYVTPVINM